MAANYGLNILISARNTAGRAFASLGQGVQGLMGAVLNLKSALAGVGATLAGAFTFGAIVNAGARAEQQLKRLEALIRTTGGAAGVTASEIVEFAEALDKATLGNADQIQDAASALLTFKAVGRETFFDVLKTAQDLSETLGADLKGSVIQIGKALEDPIAGVGALKEVGVSFTEAQREQIKTLVESNKLLEAQGIILDTLAGQVGGAAEAAASGLAGAMDRARFEFDGLLETLGEIFKPAVQAGFQQLAGLVTQLRDRLVELNAKGGIADFAQLVVDGMTRAGEAFVRFVGNLDVDAIDRSLKSIREGFNTTMTVVNFVVNGFRLAFNRIQVAAGTGVALVVDAFELLTRGAQKAMGFFGLFSDSAANAAASLKNHADAMRETGRALREDVAANAKEAEAALNNLLGREQENTAATDDLARSTAALASETQTTTKSLDDFTSGLKTNTAAKEDATAKTENLTAAEAQYGKTIAEALKAAGIQTQAELEKTAASFEKLFADMQASGKATAADLATVFTQWTEKQLAANQNASAAYKAEHAALLRNTAARSGIIELLNEELRAQLDLKTAAEKRAEADRKANEAQQRYTEDTLALMDKLGVETQRKLNETAEAASRLFTQLASDGKASSQELVAAFETWAEAEIAAAQHATEAEQKKIAESLKAAAVRADIVDKIDEEIKRVIGLGDAAREMGAKTADALAEVTKQVGRLGVEARNAEFSMDRMNDSSSGIAEGTRVVTREYGRQLEKLKKLYSQIGDINLDSVEGMEELNRLSRLSINQFDQLGSNQLGPLRDAIEDAKRQMMSFRDQTEAALRETREQLEDMQAEGDRLKQEELTFQRERAEALRQYEMARAARDREAIANTRERIKLLDEIHKRRMKEITAELDAEKELQATQARRAIEDLEASGDERRAAILQYERERADIEAELTRAQTAGEGQMIRLARDRLMLLEAAHQKRLQALDKELEAARAVNAEREKATGDTKPEPKRGGVAAFPRGLPGREVTLAFRREDGTVAGRGTFDARDAEDVEKLLSGIAAARSNSSLSGGYG